MPRLPLAELLLEKGAVISRYACVGEHGCSGMFPNTVRALQGLVEDLQRAASLTDKGTDAADDLAKVLLAVAQRWCTSTTRTRAPQRLAKAKAALKGAVKRREHLPLRRAVHDTVIIEELPTNLWEREEAGRRKVWCMRRCVYTAVVGSVCVQQPGVATRQKNRHP